MQTWSKAFPGTVQPKSEISADLMAHLRYPEDLFKLQREIYSRYHVTNPQIFYTSQAAWQVPNDPTAQGVGDVAQPPYYLSLQMPGTETTNFSLTTTYAPVNRQNLAAFMAVNSDATDPGYGTIRLLQLPDNSPVPGPSQMQNQLDSDPTVADELLALRRGGNVETQLGNLLTLPVAGGLMYVEPVFVRATEGAAYPTLQKVMVSFGDQVAIENTFPEALAFFFQQIDTGSGGGGGGGGSGGGPSGDSDAQQRLTNALEDATNAYDQGQSALAEGDFAAYGEAQLALRQALERAAQAAAQLGLKVPATEPVEPSPTPSTSPSDGASPASYTVRGSRLPQIR